MRTFPLLCKKRITFEHMLNVIFSKFKTYQFLIDSIPRVFSLKSNPIQSFFISRFQYLVPFRIIITHKVMAYVIAFSISFFFSFVILRSNGCCRWNYVSLYWFRMNLVNNSFSLLSAFFFSWQKSNNPQCAHLTFNSYKQYWIV